MENELIITLTKSAIKILRPLARIMIRNGVSCGNFEELVRKAYVDEAFAMGASDSGQGKITISSVSAKTGLSRKEVKRLKETEQIDHKQNSLKYNRAIRVISGWTNNQEFLDTSGKPTPLRLDNQVPSFSNLVKMYSGDIPAKAMQDLLLEAECIEIKDNLAFLVKPAYLPGNDSSEIALILGTDTTELVETISHNMVANESDKRFQRKVSTHKLDKTAVSAFKELAANRSQALLEELDTWLSEHEAENGDDCQYVSVGVYYYEFENKENQHD